MKRQHKLTELHTVSTQRSSPYCPIHFRITMSAIQRTSKLIHLSKIEIRLFLNNSLREKIQAKQPVPHQIILHPPTIRLVKSQSVMVTRISSHFPFFSHLTGSIHILLRFFFLIQHFCQTCICCNTQNTFGG